MFRRMMLPPGDAAAGQAMRGIVVIEKRRFFG
jgi:hypothetical protein